jgi:phosphate transport system protein
MAPKGFRIAKYDVDLRHMENCILQLLHLTRDAFVMACEALAERNIVKAEIVVGNDDVIDDLEIEVNRAASDLIMRYQPIATDLRKILAAIRVAADLERIGDTAESIARKVVWLGSQRVPPLRRLEVLADLVCARFNGLIEAYEARNVANAEDIRTYDVEIDAVYVACFSEILTMMEANPGFVRQGAQFLSIAKSFERVGDRLTNVAEQILFEVDGQTKFEERPRTTVG